MFTAAVKKNKTRCLVFSFEKCYLTGHLHKFLEPETDGKRDEMNKSLSSPTAD